MGDVPYISVYNKSGSGYIQKMFWSCFDNNIWNDVSFSNFTDVFPNGAN